MADFFLLTLLVLLLLFHAIDGDASQGLVLITVQFELRGSISVASLLRLLTVDCLSPGDSPKERMPETAGAGRTLIRIPRDHLVY